MDIKYQIFVSSTFEDLKDERRKVIEQILNLGHIPVGMELFQAGDETQWDLIKRRILECDYYIVIVAERYGAEGPAKKSYTRMEYEFAIKSRVPTISFLLHKDARKEWPSDKVEFEQKEKVQEFRNLCQKKIVQFWSNSDDLGAKVVTSLTQQFRDKPRIGWIRADRVASIETANEIARLSEEKRNLQNLVSKFESENSYKIPPLISHKLDVLSKIPLKEYVFKNPRSPDRQPIESDKNLLELFMYCSRSFASGVSIYIIERLISTFISSPKNEHISVDSAIQELIAQDMLHIIYTNDIVFDRIRSEASYHLTSTAKIVITCYEMQNKLENKHSLDDG